MQWQAENPQVHSTNARIALQVFSILFLVITVLFLCACIFLRSSINLAIKVVALAATAIEAMVLLIFTPLLNVTGLAIFLVPCLLYGFNVASNGSFTTQYYTYTNPITTISTQVRNEKEKKKKGRRLLLGHIRSHSHIIHLTHPLRSTDCLPTLFFTLH